MITRFTVENFKSFAESTDVELCDLLVVAGSNSCGKSTLLQALLLLAQTLDIPRSDVVLDLGGKYVQFAEFRDAVFSRPVTIESSMSFGFRVLTHEADPAVALRDGSSLELLGSREFIKTADNKVKVQRTIDVQITFAANRSGTPTIQGMRFEKSDSTGSIVKHVIEKYRRKYRITIAFVKPNESLAVSASALLDEIKSFGAEVAKPPESSPRQRRMLQSFFRQYNIDVNSPPQIAGELFAELGKVKVADYAAWPKEYQERFSKILDGVLAFLRQEQATITMILPLQFDHFLPRMGVYSEDSRLTNYSNNLEGAFGDSIREIRRYLRRITYVGPLRAKPERAYLPAGTPPDIGNAGENAVPILWLEQYRRVMTKTESGDNPTEKPLARAVQEWFEEFGIASSLHVTKPKRVIYQAEMESAPGSKTKVTIADVGFGISQLLPVIIAGLRAPQDSTVVFEQPEIHLHPRLQAKLADFFICLGELRKKVIVETHSEHLINTLRLRVAQDRTGELQKRIGILFVRGQEKQSQGLEPSRKGSYIENLTVDEYGNITNWPPDFFPEHSELNENILKAMMDKYSKRP